MQRTFTRIMAAAAVVGLAACSDATSPPADTTPNGLLNESLINNDVAVASAEVIIGDIAQMSANESFAGLPSSTPPFGLFTVPQDFSVTRTRTCYDATNTAQAQCDAQTTASIVFTLTIDGSFARTSSGPRGTDSMEVAFHRARNLTVSGLLGTETSRTHDGVGTSSDTSHFVGIHEERTLVRDAVSASVDSVQSVVFNLPHAANPFPVSGSIVRHVTGSVTLTVNDSTATRSFDRLIRVTFPPDGQGNVTMTITAGGTTKTCLLNLVTHRVTGCQ
jgi:hypothetical protein